MYNLNRKGRRINLAKIRLAMEKKILNPFKLKK